MKLETHQFGAGNHKRVHKPGGRNKDKFLVRLNRTHAATHNICGLCVPRRRCSGRPTQFASKTGVGNYRTFHVF